MENPILSIVIPVYGVEKFIEDCIQSCLDNINQLSKEAEVVVVDDGSKAFSIDIAKKLIGDLPNFHFITQLNQGLSVARNTGLEASRGQYVWFVDSDDIISVGIVKKIIHAIEMFQSLDMIELGYEFVSENVNRLSLSKVSDLEIQATVITGRQRFSEGFLTPVPFHVFRRAFLLDKKLRMYPGIYHEDSDFTPRALWLAEHVITLHDIAYYYRKRDNSIMTTINPKKGEDYLFVSHRLQDFFAKQDTDNKTRKKINDYIAMIYCNGLHNIIGANEDGYKRVANAAFEHRIVLRSLMNAIKLKYRILGYLAFIFPKNIADIYYIMMKFK